MSYLRHTSHVCDDLLAFVPAALAGHSIDIDRLTEADIRSIRAGMESSSKAILHNGPAHSESLV